MSLRKIIRYPRMRPRFYTLKAIADIGNKRNLPTWPAWTTQSANLAWKSPHLGPFDQIGNEFHTGN
jgi:hypothetical protein